jgi:hypothetical protein
MISRDGVNKFSLQFGTGIKTFTSGFETFSTSDVAHQARRPGFMAFQGDRAFYREHQ